MAYHRVSLADMQQHPVAAFRSGNGAPVGVEQDGVILFFLVSSVDVVTGKISPAAAAIATDRGERRVNLNEAAALTGKSKSTISRNISSKKLPAEELGNTLQIKVADLATVFDLDLDKLLEIE